MVAVGCVRETRSRVCYAASWCRYRSRDRTNHMKPTILASVLPNILLHGWLGAVATAQSLSISVPSPITASASFGGSTQTAVLPAGPAAAGGTIAAYTSASAPTPFARFGWYSVPSESLIGFVGFLGCAVQGAGAGPVSVAPGQLLLELTAPGVTPVILELSAILQVSAGSPAPSVRVDVGDDGTFEFTEISLASNVAVNLTSTPLRIRVELAAALTAPGSIEAQLQMFVRPDQGTFVTPLIAGCDPLAFHVASTFAGDVVVQAPNASMEPVVAVFGLSVQPLQVNPGAQWPCLLMPGLDLVMLLPGASPLTLPIPAAARPITLLSQAVVVHSLSGPLVLTTTDGYRITAL